MKSLRILFFFSVLFFSCDLFSQKQNVGLDTTQKQLAVNPSDTNDISLGVIFVRKPHINPYVKVNYKFYLVHVDPKKNSQREVQVTDANSGFTDTQIQKIPIFDSSVYSKKLKRDYPAIAQPLSKYFVENMSFQYQPNDTPRVDTMLVGIWIDARGKVRIVLPDTENVGTMPSKMIAELYRVSTGISEWGAGGDYRTPKKFLRSSQLIFESYYCEAYVIVSSFPLTVEQKKNGAASAPFDYPLNCPTMDTEQKKSLEKNGYRMY